MLFDVQFIPSTLNAVDGNAVLPVKNIATKIDPFHVTDLAFPKRANEFATLYHVVASVL
jgi:hypothetical protein